MSCKSIVLLSLCLILSSCTNLKNNSDSSPANYSFIGNWEGKGADSEGNEFTFFARVNRSGDNEYRILQLDKLDTQNKPIHILDGVLENNKFSYTADDGLFKGGGTLSKDLFEGYYEGPVNGTFRMQRIHNEIEAR